jgi:hypothetical protein
MEIQFRKKNKICILSINTRIEFKKVHISYTGKYLYDGEFQVHVPVVEIFRFL